MHMVKHPLTYAAQYESKGSSERSQLNASDIRAKYATASNVRPEALANDLGVSGKTVRNYLRSAFKRPIEAHGTTWVLSNEQAKQTVEFFLARRSPVNAEPQPQITVTPNALNAQKGRK